MWNVRQAHRQIVQSESGGTSYLLAVALMVMSAAGIVRAQDAWIRAVIPHVQLPIKIDGQLTDDEYRGALCTPVEYFHEDVRNRPAQFFFLWDEEAFYLGLRTLDQRSFAPETKFWEGDAIEFYLDTRRGPEFLSAQWPREPAPGAVHCFFTAMNREELSPRFTLRPNFEQAIPKVGIAMAARRIRDGLELEVRLPWSNFPGFKPAAGEIVGLDSELSYSDGGERSYRTFVFGSPLSVSFPANLSRVKLANRFENNAWTASGPVMMPLRIDVPWKQELLPLQFVAQIAMPPGRFDDIGSIIVHVADLHGNSLGSFPADKVTYLDTDQRFAIRHATWPISLAAPGSFLAYAVVLDQAGSELTRVAPRFVSVNNIPGY